MRTFFKENKILFIFVAIGLLAAIVALSGRMQTEAKNKHYDVVLDYQEMENMAAQSEESLDWWFAQFQGMGINKVGLLEESLSTIMEHTKMPVSADVMYQIAKNADWEKDYPQSFINEMKGRGYDDYDVIVESKSKDSFLFIADAFRKRWDDSKYIILETQDGGYLWIDGTAKDALYSETYKNMDSQRKPFSEQSEVISSKIMYLSLGLLPERVQRLEKEGMEIIPRTASYEGWNDTRYAKAVLEGHQSLKNVRYQYYGYEGAKEIENTLFRAITERNIRIIYYKPIRELDDYHVYVTDVDEYKTMFENLNARLTRHGITLGQASIMDVYTVRRLIKVLIGFGCISGAVLLLGAFLPMKKKLSLVLLGLGCVGVLGAYVVMPNLAQLLSSFASAVIFPCLAIIYFMHKGNEYSNLENKSVRLGKIIGISAAILAVSAVISLVGAFMTTAPLSEVNFMLEMDIFRGVKIAQLLPLAFFVLAYLAYFGFGAKKRVPGRLELHDLKNIMEVKIQIWMIIMGSLMAGIGAYYIIRTGHDTAIEPSTLEMLFRNELEDVLLARPRNKEFLFAFPAVMLMIYSCFRGFKIWRVIFGLCSVIGMTSIVNTFMHIRTPLYLGIARTAYSLCFGVIIGMIGIVVFELIYQLYKKAEVKFF